MFREPQGPRWCSFTLYPGVSLSWLRIFSGVLSSSQIILDPEEHRGDYVETWSSPTSQLNLPLCFPEATVKQEAQVEMMEGESKPHIVYLPKSDEKEDVILPSPRGSLPYDAFHRREGGTVGVTGRSASFDHSESTVNAPATLVMAASIHVPPLDTDAANLEIKCSLMTEIRRYGRRKSTKNGYGRIFKLLEEVQGPLEVQLRFVKFAIKEAAKYHLISYLDEFLDKLMSETTIRSNDLNLSR